MVIKLIILVLLAILFPMMSAAQQYVPTENEEIYGTWINTSYTQGLGASYWASYWQKIVHNPNGTIESYMSAADMAHFTGAIAFVAKWTDSQGNILYKAKSGFGILIINRP